MNKIFINTVAMGLMGRFFRRVYFVHDMGGK